jgi:mannitol/fructose-specific phosphotransferase system IIA component (Ntr-type)
MRLAELLQPGDVTIRFRASDLTAAASTLLRGALVRHQVPEATIESIMKAVAERESEGSTLCGTIGLPHARDKHVDGIIAAVGLNPDGVLEGRPEPRIVIAFVSPEGKRDQHLHFLSEAARLSRDASRVDRIVKAADEGAAIEAMR